MDVTIELGWWLAPLAVTALAFGALYAWADKPTHAHGYAAIGQGIVELVGLCVALIVSLVAWLIWAVLA